MSVDVEASVREYLAQNSNFTEVHVRQMIADADPCPEHPSRPEHMCVTCWDTRRRLEEERQVADQRAKEHLQLNRDLPARFRCAATDHPSLIAWCEEFATSPAKAGNLILTGPTSSGKTHAAAGVLRRAIPAYVAMTGNPRSGARYLTVASWRWWNLAALASAMRPGGDVDGAKVLRESTEATLLVLDDLGTARMTEWVEEYFYTLINTRYETMRPTIVTTNLTPAEFKNTLGERIASRLAAGAVTVTLQGRDYRRNPAEKTAICPVHGVNHDERPVELPAPPVHNAAWWEN